MLRYICIGFHSFTWLCLLQIQDYDDTSNDVDPNVSENRRDRHDDGGYPAERLLSPENANQLDAAPQLDVSFYLLNIVFFVFCTVSLRRLPTRSF